jgi:hypothetical protein
MRYNVVHQGQQFRDEGIRIFSFVPISLTMYLILWMNGSSVFSILGILGNNYVKIGVYISWLFLALVSNNKYLTSFLRRYYLLIVFWITTAILLNILDNQELFNYVKNIQWLIMIFSIYHFINSQSDRIKNLYNKSIIATISLDLVMTTYFTFRALLINPYYSRFISTSKESQILLLKDAKYFGAGGYSFAYSMALVALVLIYFSLKESNIYKRLLYILMSLIIIILVFKMQFLISVILVIYLGSLMVYQILFGKTAFYFNSITITTSIIIMISIIGLNPKFLLILQDILPVLFADKFENIAYYYSQNKFDNNFSLARIDLYLVSITNYLQRPIFGNWGMVPSGNHSTILDIFSNFGIISFPILYTIYRKYKESLTICTAEQFVLIKTIYLFILIFSLVNISLITQIMVILFLFIPALVQNINNSKKISQ